MSSHLHGSPRSLTVAVLTYRRPADLALILPILVEQAVSVRSADLSTDVLVVDNNPAGGARATVDEFVTTDCAVRYVHEPEPGIVPARNCALECAGTDLIAFIDDDERPTPQWLAHLLETYSSTPCAAVAGYMTPVFEVEPDPWIVAGRFFQRRSLPTGSSMTVAATNNLLLDLRVVRSHGLSFDPAYGLTGGEDTLFTRQLVNAGERIVWCQEAVAHDAVPPSRTTRSWVVKRAFSSGSRSSRTSLALIEGPAARTRERLVLSCSGAARAVVGLARALVGSVFGHRRHSARGTRLLARGLGMLCGAWGYAYQEYRRADPEPATRRSPLR